MTPPPLNIVKKAALFLQDGFPKHCSYSTKTNKNNKRKQCTVAFQGTTAVQNQSSLFTKAMHSSAKENYMSNCIFAFRYVDDHCFKSTQ